MTCGQEWPSFLTVILTCPASVVKPQLHREWSARHWAAEVHPLRQVLRKQHRHENKSIRIVQDVHQHTSE